MSEAISRELLGKIVDEVFDRAIEDASVIEDIYAAIKRHEAAAPSSKPVAAREELSDLIAEAITAHWGERCTDINAECVVCQVWAEFDRRSPPPHAKMAGALRLAREWLPSVEAHIYDSEKFKIDLATIDAVLAGETARAELSVGGAPTHRHKKRGITYVLIGIGKMQAEKWGKYFEGVGYSSVDMREVAIYRSTDDGSLWVRPREEFEDGRFEAISASGVENG